MSGMAGGLLSASWSLVVIRVPISKMRLRPTFISGTNKRNGETTTYETSTERLAGGDEKADPLCLRDGDIVASSAGSRCRCNQRYLRD